MEQHQQQQQAPEGQTSKMHVEIAPFTRRRVTIYRNGELRHGKVLFVPEGANPVLSWKLFLSESARLLLRHQHHEHQHQHPQHPALYNEEVASFERVYNWSGGEITSTELILPNEILFLATADEEFIIPHSLLSPHMQQLLPPVPPHPAIQGNLFQQAAMSADSGATGQNHQRYANSPPLAFFPPIAPQSSSSSSLPPVSSFSTTGRGSPPFLYHQHVQQQQVQQQQQQVQQQQQQQQQQQHVQQLHHTMDTLLDVPQNEMLLNCNTQIPPNCNVHLLPIVENKWENMNAITQQQLEQQWEMLKPEEQQKFSIYHNPEEKSRRPLTGFNLFYAEKCREIRDEPKNIPNVEIGGRVASKIAHMWNALSDGEKKKYNQLARRQGSERRDKQPNNGQFTFVQIHAPHSPAHQAQLHQIGVSTQQAPQMEPESGNNVGSNGNGGDQPVNVSAISPIPLRSSKHQLTFVPFVPNKSKSTTLHELQDDDHHDAPSSQQQVELTFVPEPIAALSMSYANKKRSPSSQHNDTSGQANQPENQDVTPPPKRQRSLK